MCITRNLIYMNIRLIEKYFAGKATEKEKEEVFNFFKRQNIDPYNEHILSEWWSNYKPDKNYDHLSEHTLKKINKRLDHYNNQQSFRLPHFLKVAAVFLIFLSVTFVIYRSGIIQGDSNQKLAQHITKQAPEGAKMQFMLPIHLNSGSKLIFPETFSDDLREVKLEGEAYFEVEKDVQRPFVVLCQEVETRVLGTSFNISAYDPDNIIISLTSGSVKVSYNNNSLDDAILKPGEQFTYNRKIHSSSIVPFDIYKITAWKNGVLIFDDADLKDIVNKLERWYGVEIQVNGLEDLNEVKWNYSGEFDNESLDIVLSGIGYVKGFDFEIQDKKVYLNM